MTKHGIWAVVPVKEFAFAKERLAPALAPEERRALSRTMVEDVLSALAAAEGLAGVVVVTRDPEATALAERRGARVLPEPKLDGHNAAVHWAVDALAREGAAAMLHVPGDVPLVTARDVSALLDTADLSDRVALVPAHDGRGTNAVLCAPPGAIAFHFGADSFRRHLAAATQAGITPRVVTSTALGLDIDEPDDLRRFLRHDRETRTGRYLHESGIARRLSAAPRPAWGTDSIGTAP